MISTVKMWKHWCTAKVHPHGSWCSYKPLGSEYAINLQLFATRWRLICWLSLTMYLFVLFLFFATRWSYHAVGIRDSLRETAAVAVISLRPSASHQTVPGVAKNPSTNSSDYSSHRPFAIIKHTVNQSKYMPPGLGHRLMSQLKETTIVPYVGLLLYRTTEIITSAQDAYFLF